MDARDIYDYNETCIRRENEEVFREVIVKFFEYTRYTFFELLSSRSFNSYSEEFYFLKNLVYTKAPRLIPTLNAILDLYGYNKQFEVVDSVKILTKHDNLRDIKDASDYVMLSPNILDFKYNDGRMLLKTRMGEYNFENIRQYLKDNNDASKYLSGHDSTNLCHQASWELLNYLDQCDLVTSFTPSYFGGWVYHTYLDQDGVILDAANGCVMDKEEYYKLLKPSEIVRTEKDKVLDEYYKIVDYKELEKEFYQPMVIALNKQRG